LGEEYLYPRRSCHATVSIIMFQFLSVNINNIRIMVHLRSLKNATIGAEALLQ
jgi:hypothetical protein